jgi:RimJ/RimL family protein N-acetyltransferase
MIPIPTLETERLILRAPQTDDFPAFAAFYASDRARFVGGPVGAETSWRTFACEVGHWELRGFGRWAVCEKDTGTFVGIVGLWHPRDWPEPEIGWDLMNGFEGKGYATEAAEAARAYAFSTLGWPTAISSVAEGNDASVAVARRLGATRDGSFIHPQFGPMQVFRHTRPDEPEPPKKIGLTEIKAPRLETERLILRAPGARDLEEETAFYASDRAAHVGGPIDADRAWRSMATIIGHWHLRGYSFWGIDEKSTGRYLGRVALWYPVGWPEPELGWTLMSHAEGRGFATEAAEAARRHAYGALGWATAISLIAQGNDRSVALAERLGATLESDYEHERFGKVLIYRHPGPEVLA